MYNNNNNSSNNFKVPVGAEQSISTDTEYPFIYIKKKPYTYIHT